jgi:hypothetical protein
MFWVMDSDPFKRVYAPRGNSNATLLDIYAHVLPRIVSVSFRQ